MEDNKFISQLEATVKKSCQIDNELFEKFDVKRDFATPTEPVYLSD